MGKFLVSISAMLAFAIAGVPQLGLDQFTTGVIGFGLGVINVGIVTYMNNQQKITVTASSTVEPTK